MGPKRVYHRPRCGSLDKWVLAPLPDSTPQVSAAGETSRQREAGCAAVGTHLTESTVAVGAGTVQDLGGLQKRNAIRVRLLALVENCAFFSLATQKRHRF